MAQTKKKTDDDLWAMPWRYSYVSRPVSWCVAAWLGILVIRELAVPLLWLVLAASAVAIAAPLIASAFGAPLAGRWFAFLLWTFVGAYTCWVIGTDQFQPSRLLDWLPTRPAFLVWIPAGATFGAWWHWLRRIEHDEHRAEVAEAKQAEVDAARARYLPILKRVLKKKPEWQGITEKGRIPFPAGVTIVLRLPADGTITFETLDAITGNLEVAADVRPGSLMFEKPVGGTAAEVHLHVFEQDVLAQTLPFPFDRGPKSIHYPIELGQYATGDVCVVTFREVAALMVGLRGSGKSSLLNTHLAHLTGCVDALVWMIDLKGGRTVKPWLRPFLEAVRQANLPEPRPALDWAAVTEAEADAMLIAINAAVRARAKAGRGSKIRPSADTPAIILIVEEASLVTGVGKYGNIDRAGKLQDAVNTGRSEACDALVCSQRATVTMVGNGDMKSNLDLRYGLGVTSADEARMVFPDGNAAKALNRIPTDKEHRGSFLVQAPDDGARIMPAKGYWIDDDAIPGIALTNAVYQPDLDEFTVTVIEAALSQAGVSGGYAGRWDRTRRDLGYDDDETSHGGVSETPAGPSQDQAQGPSQETAETRGAQLVRDAVERHREQQRETADRETRETFERLMHGAFPGGELTGETGGEPSQAGVSETREPPAILRYMAAIFAAHDADQLPTRVLVDDLPGDLNAHQLGRLANLCGFTSIENVKDGDKRVRGYARDDVLGAIGRAYDGRIPPAAYGWTP